MKIKYLLIYLATAAALLPAAGCKGWQEDLDALKLRHEQVSAKLGAQIDAAERDLQTLSSLLAAAQKGDWITGFKEDPDGWTLTFKNYGTVRLQSGRDGAVPALSAKLHSDGKYYWTLGGQWLLSGGAMTPASGADGKDALSPQIRINPQSKEWEVSTDGGKSWTGSGISAEGSAGADGAPGPQGAAGAAGTSFFQSVSLSEDGKLLLITLRDGTSLKMPVGKPGTGPGWGEEEPKEYSDGQIAGHGYVDLDLPSGTKWATRNVGAETFYGCGDFISWGETASKNDYSYENYKWCPTGNHYTRFIKYVSDEMFGAFDGKSVLDKEDDAARAIWGEPWRMPTLAQAQELLDFCAWTWTKLGGINGHLVSSKKNPGKWIFLPASGAKFEADVYHTLAYHDGLQYYGAYWTTKLNEKNNAYAIVLACGINPYTEELFTKLSENHFRSDGLTIRAVTD